MLLEFDKQKLTYKCDTCGCKKVINFCRKKMKQSQHICSPCQARKISRLGYEAASKKGLHSIGGKIGGRKTADTGKLAETSRIISKRPEVKEKIFATKRKNGLLRQSRGELLFLEELKILFPNAVKHHVILAEFQIDFLVNEKIYVEFDGVYWHGLDRHYDDLGDDQRKKFDRDRRLEKYCRDQNLTLVRVTDDEFYSSNWKKNFKGVLP